MEMNIRMRLFIAGIVVLVSYPLSVCAWAPTPVDDDPLVRLPGTQPSPSAVIAAPSHETKGGEKQNYACNNCHSGNPLLESEQGMPFFSWQGSMMAQAARDPIFWATMTVAAQDSIWAVGRPNATDICLRCHFPEGWMSDRSEQLNASAMTGSDYDGVHCGICHRLYDPFSQSLNDGTREGGVDQATYWDEATGLSLTKAADTAAADSALAQTVGYFESVLGPLFDLNGYPKESGYEENGAAQMYMDTDSAAWNNMRGPFADPLADAHETNNVQYSRYHKSKYFCGTCHDVSNPVLTNLGDDPSDGLITEQQSPSSYAHVERTFSEFMSSGYSQTAGLATNAEFQSLGGVDSAGKCQDCHMPEINGVGVASGNVPLRPGDSNEHPNSGASTHSFMGGNMWMTRILASLDEALGAPVYDTVNLGLLNQGAEALTLDLSQGHSYDSDKYGTAMLSASDRAKSNLQRAATIKNPVFNQATGELSFLVQNNTAHKLLTGFIEGRRIWLNIKAYSGASVVYEINPYDDAAGTFKGGLSFWNYDGNDGLGGTVVPDPAALTEDEIFLDDLLYEGVTSSSLTGEDHTFHFALADSRYKDNRIPPKSFSLSEALNRKCEPVASGGVADSTATPADNLYSEAENAGGFDAVTVTIPDHEAKNITRFEIGLNYQGTTREYVEFLRDEINGTGANRALYGPDNAIGSNNVTFYDAAGALVLGETANGDNAYLIQSLTEPSAAFFSGLAAWGETIWQLWYHNHGLDGTGTPIEGLSPFEMTAVQLGPAGTVEYTLEMQGDGTGYLEDTLTKTVLCAKTTEAPTSCTLIYPAAAALSINAVKGAESVFTGYSGNATFNDTLLTDTATATETVQATFTAATSMNMALRAAISIAAEKGDEEARPPRE